MKTLIIFAIFHISFFSNAMGEKSYPSGKIESITIDNHRSNYAVQVKLAHINTPCAKGRGLLFINADDTNFQPMLSALLSAKAMSLNVKMETIIDSPSGCHITIITI